jgi:RNA polymerase sigma-70 factor, ECF subfamily
VDHLEELYRRFAPLVHARARRIVGDEAEDLVQEVFIKLMHVQPQPEKIVAWLYATSTNLCLDRLRHHRRRHAEWQRQVGEHVDSAKDRDLESLLTDQQLCGRLLSHLDRKTQEVLVYTIFDEMTQQETAELLGISRKTVGERLNRFQQVAKKLVERWKKQNT